MIDATPSAIQLFITGYVTKTILSVLTIVTIWFFCFPIRTLFSAIKEKWNTQNEVLTAIQSELYIQRTNHLHHIEKSSEAQVKLLEGIAETMRDSQLTQAEISGYLRGIS